MLLFLATFCTLCNILLKDISCLDKQDIKEYRHVISENIFKYLSKTDNNHRYRFIQKQISFTGMQLELMLFQAWTEVSRSHPSIFEMSFTYFHN